MCDWTASCIALERQLLLNESDYAKWYVMKLETILLYCKRKL